MQQPHKVAAPRPPAVYPTPRIPIASNCLQMPSASNPVLRAACAETAGQLHAKALKAVPELHGQLSPEEFTEVLVRSASAHFGKAPTPPAAVRAYLESLHVADLALACACARGNEAAWEHFMSAYRPALYAAARAVAGESAGRELADSLYADLYGLKEREGRRQSLFDYFHGRSKLATWLRAVLAQRHIDAVRSSRRTISLDERLPDSDEAGHPRELESSGVRPQAATVRAAEFEPDRRRYLNILQVALTAALQALEPRDRLRLSYYYLQDLTLAQIGRLLGEHEATVSRKLDRIRSDLRGRVDRTLREEKRLSEAQVKLCYEYAGEEWPFDLAAVLSERE